MTFDLGRPALVRLYQEPARVAVDDERRREPERLSGSDLRGLAGIRDHLLARRTGAALGQREQESRGRQLEEGAAVHGKLTRLVVTTAAVQRWARRAPERS